LNKSNKVFNNAIVKGWKLCGHNIKAFDVPCLGKRMLYNGISPSSNIMVGDKKPWEIPFVDTSELFSFGSWSMQKSLSLDLLACSLGVDSPKDDISGKEVTKAYWNGEEERIKEYCEKDVNTVIEILKKTSY
jgi:predicted PolB exonuclease-like 3'-5' exonuclease